MCIFYDRINLHSFDINIHSQTKNHIGFAGLPRWVAEAAFFFPKLCFAPREGENTANLRHHNKRNGALKRHFNLWIIQPIYPPQMIWRPYRQPLPTR